MGYSSKELPSGQFLGINAGRKIFFDHKKSPERIFH